MRYLIALRRRHRVFSRPRFFRGEVVSEAGLKDITWVTQAGVEATAEDWGNPVALSLGYVLCGAAGEFYTPGGQRDIDESFLVMMSAYYDDLAVPFPAICRSRSSGRRWSIPPSRAGSPPDGRLWRAGESYRLRAHSFALFINRAPVAPAPAQIGNGRGNRMRCPPDGEPR